MQNKKSKVKIKKTKLNKVRNINKKTTRVLNEKNLPYFLKMYHVLLISKPTYGKKGGSTSPQQATTTTQHEE
jgi:hypothetical protein